MIKYEFNRFYYGGSERIELLLNDSIKIAKSFKNEYFCILLKKDWDLEAIEDLFDNLATFIYEHGDVYFVVMENVELISDIELYTKEEIISEHIDLIKSYYVEHYKSNKLHTINKILNFDGCYFEVATMFFTAFIGNSEIMGLEIDKTSIDVMFRTKYGEPCTSSAIVYKSSNSEETKLKFKQRMIELLNYSEIEL